MRTAVYPGTFDPITSGHMDIIKRSLPLVDKLVISVAKYSDKETLFTLEERVEMVKQDVLSISENIEVHSFDTLLVDYARSINASMIVRGLRAVSDFEYEFKMAAMNTHLAPDVETVFLMASDYCQFVSSRFVKEVARLNGDVGDFVSDNVHKNLKKRLQKSA
jgi:pantetheine-phosphate adenylyltransferase